MRNLDDELVYTFSNDYEIIYYLDKREADNIYNEVRKGDIKSEILTADELRNKQNEMQTKELAEIKRLLEDAIVGDYSSISMSTLKESTKEFLVNKGYTIEYQRCGIQEYKWVIKW